ncbi:hypothetical protein RUND412_002108 [Rhizina undulata]
MDCFAMRFTHFVKSLIYGDANAEREIVMFTRLIPREPLPEAGPDCTILKLEGLRWGLTKYGHNAEGGGSFFGSLKSIAWVLPNGLSFNPSPPPRLGSQTIIGYDVIPRPYPGPAMAILLAAMERAFQKSARH